MILIQCFSRKLEGKENPKNYPYWKELIALIDEPIVQIGTDDSEKLVEDFRKNLPFSEIEKLVGECRIWIAIDSFLQHLGWYLGKPGIVLWGQSDPKIFGHKENINLLKDKKYLRTDQFLWWRYADYNKEAFVEPAEVIKHLK